MSDWNPAEIIGKNSYPLSIFVYNFLVLKFNWYLQRYQNGYSKLENKKLYYQIGNTLYIDVIQSFLSFIPRNLDKKIRTKLLNFYINKLYINPKLHDKIESEIVVSNYSQKFLDKIKSTELKNYEIDLLRNQLLKSNKIIKEHVNEHFSSLGELNKESINIQKKNTKYNNFKKIFEILKITQKKFILPFAHLARGSFVSKIILQDFFSEKQTNNIISNIETISTLYRKDIASLSSVNFHKKYKHLVPNTYDFTNLIRKNYKIKNTVNIIQKRGRFSLVEILKKNIKIKKK